MTQSLEIGRASIVVKVLFLVVGAVLSLSALGFIPIDPSTLHTSPWLLFTCGLVFFATGLVGVLARRREERPAGHALAIALLTSAMAISGGLAAVYSHDEKLIIGPWVFSGPRVDAFGKVVIGSCAILQGSVAAWCWKLWWRALARGRESNG